MQEYILETDNTLRFYEGIPEGLEECTKAFYDCVASKEYSYVSLSFGETLLKLYQNCEKYKEGKWLQ